MKTEDIRHGDTVFVAANGWDGEIGEVVEVTDQHLRVLVNDHIDVTLRWTQIEMVLGERDGLTIEQLEYVRLAFERTRDWLHGYSIVNEENEIAAGEPIFRVVSLQASE